MLTGQVVREASASLAIAVGARVEEVLSRAFDEADQIFLDVTDRSGHEAQEGPAATGERGGALTSGCPARKRFMRAGNRFF
ncbi:hypothetical protein [Streptomyces sp. NPDC048282]|uniref:hypothetical protein n=1 Tax=Streptomyces sp. NPDC048282 TaxID=3365528 RepID=UPI003713281D